MDTAAFLIGLTGLSVLGSILVKRISRQHFPLAVTLAVILGFFTVATWVAKLPSPALWTYLGIFILVFSLIQGADNRPFFHEDTVFKAILSGVIGLIYAALTIAIF